MDKRTETGENIVKVEDGRLPGDMLTCFPINGADIMKKTGCLSAQAARLSEMESEFRYDLIDDPIDRLSGYSLSIGSFRRGDHQCCTVV